MSLPQEHFILTVKSLIFAGKKIEAIKEVRSVLGLGLKEAKDVVEACYDVKTMDPLTKIARFNMMGGEIQSPKTISIGFGNGATVTCSFSEGTFSCSTATELQLKQAMAMIEAAKNCDVGE